MNIHDYWKVTLAQQADEMKKFFHKDAVVNWHNTNERFTADEFIRANCEYPGEWNGNIEKIVEHDDFIITAVNVFSKDKALSLHVVSFFEIKDDKIESIDEYWGDDGEAPKWRRDMNIGVKIR